MVYSISTVDKYLFRLQADNNKVACCEKHFVTHVYSSTAAADTMSIFVISYHT